MAAACERWGGEKEHSPGNAQWCKPGSSAGEARGTSRPRGPGSQRAPPKVKQGGPVIHLLFKDDLCGGRVEHVLQRQQGHAFTKITAAEHLQGMIFFTCNGCCLEMVPRISLVCCLLYYAHGSCPPAPGVVGARKRARAGEREHGEGVRGGGAGRSVGRVTAHRTNRNGLLRNSERAGCAEMGPGPTRQRSANVFRLNPPSVRKKEQGKQHPEVL